MSRAIKIENFDPNGVGVHNGHFIGLPFAEEDAQVIMIPVPWDLTVSSGTGTHTGPENVLKSSYQLDLYDDYLAQAWQMGIYMQEIDQTINASNIKFRPDAEKYIMALESGQEISKELQEEVIQINTACEEMLRLVQSKCAAILEANKCFGIIGGDHSVALAGIKACANKYKAFGILQIDAHMDLRHAYEGFTYSHASIFHNAMQVEQVKKLVQVGIRDYCQEELDFAKEHKQRIVTFTDSNISEQLFTGSTFATVCEQIIDSLPEQVYISFDIDGLMPTYCPNTGTPVPGGISFNHAKYLLKSLVEKGKKIIGFDLCEVAGIGNSYDGNVGARVAYMLCNYMGKSQNLI